MNPNPFQQSKHQHQLNLQQAITNLHTHCSGFIHHLSQQIPVFNPNSSNLHTHFQSTFSSFQKNAKQAFDDGVSRLNSLSMPSNGPIFARIADDSKTQTNPVRKPAPGLSTEDIEERLAGVPVYALSNPNEEFVLVSGVSSGRSLGLMCFQKEDADTLLQEMKNMDPSMRKEGSKVVAIALNKVVQLKVDGVAFRFIPDSTQIKNALMERQKAGLSHDDFHGVPVFQSRSLVLRSRNKSYRPVFFRKEDLDKSLLRASKQQNLMNPTLRQGDIQVAVFEEVLKGMKDASDSKWNDIVFIPPGFDVSTDFSQLQR